MTRLKVNVYIPNSLFKDSEGNIKITIINDYLKSFSRFCGILNSQWNITLKDNIQTIEIEVNDQNITLENLQKIDNPIEYAKKVLDLIANKEPELDKANKLFQQENLYKVEIEFFHINQKRLSLERVKTLSKLAIEQKREDNRYVTFLKDYLLLMCHYTYPPNQKNLNLIFNRCSKDEKQHNNPIFLLLALCALEPFYLSDQVDNVLNADSNYTDVFQKIKSIKDDTSYERAFCYYQLASVYNSVFSSIYHKNENFLEIAKKNREPIKRNKELINIMKMSYQKSVISYQNSLEENENLSFVYQKFYDLLLCFNDIYSKEEEKLFLEKLEFILKKIENKPNDNLNSLQDNIAKFKILLQISEIYYNIDNYNMAINAAESAEKHGENIRDYLQLVYLEKGTKIIEEKLESILNLTGLYAKLVSYYWQIEGVYSKKGNRYEKKYFKVKDIRERIKKRNGN